VVSFVPICMNLCRARSCCDASSAVYSVGVAWGVADFIADDLPESQLRR
jgi:hypothetical protein